MGRKFNFNQFNFFSLKSSSDNPNISNNVKHYYLKRISVGVIIIVGVSIGASEIYDFTGMASLKRADFISYSADLLEDYKITGVASECFFSTKTDKSIIDRIEVFKEQKDFDSWYDKHHDIIRSAPAGIAETNAEDYFSRGYYAVVTSPSALYDPDKNVLATGKYSNDDGHLVIVLSQLRRDENYTYDKDVSAECKQIYTVIFLHPGEIESASSIDFALDV